MNNSKSCIISRAATVLLACLVLLFCSSPASADETSTPQPNLSGTWKLNKDLSDDPQEVMKQAGERMRHGRGSSGRGMPEGRGGRMGGRGGRMGPRGGGMQGRPQMGGAMRELLEGEELLHIAQDDVKLTVGVSDKAIELYTDGRPLRQETDKGEIIRKAAWEGDILVVRSDMPNGGTMTRTYRLAEGGRSLHVTVLIEPAGGPGKIQIEYHYDAVLGEEGRQSHN